MVFRRTTSGEIMPPEAIIEGIEEDLRDQAPITPPDPTTLGGPAETPISDTYSGSLDDAATLLLRQLVPSIRDYAFELADIVLKIPRWQLVLGAVLMQHESGTLQAPSIDPSWRQIEVAIGRSICGYAKCKKEFIPKRFGEVFCSPECGVAKKKEEIAERNRRREMEMKMRRAEEKAIFQGSMG